MILEIPDNNENSNMIINSIDYSDMPGQIVLERNIVLKKDPEVRFEKC